MRQRAVKDWEQVREKEKEEADSSPVQDDCPRTKPTFAGFVKGCVCVLARQNCTGARHRRLMARSSRQMQLEDFSCQRGVGVGGFFVVSSEISSTE